MAVEAAAVEAVAVEATGSSAALQQLAPIMWVTPMIGAFLCSALDAHERACFDSVGDNMSVWTRRSIRAC